MLIIKIVILIYEDNFISNLHIKYSDNADTLKTLNLYILYNYYPFTILPIDLSLDRGKVKNEVFFLFLHVCVNF
jgi:hypothetical protein